MRYDFRRGEILHSIELLDLNDGTFRARVEERGLEDSATDEPRAVHEFELHVVECGPGVLSVVSGSDVHDAVVDRDGEARTVALPSGTVALEHVDPFRAGGAAGIGSASGPQSVSSPMPGRVVEVVAEEGATVAAGQTLVVVEAMKMANELKSPIDGVVQSVHVAAGDAVEARKPLVVVQPK